jgi:hypothetical protein
MGLSLDPCYFPLSIHPPSCPALLGIQTDVHREVSQDIDTLSSSHHSLLPPASAAVPVMNDAGCLETGRNFAGPLSVRGRQ